MTLVEHYHQKGLKQGLEQGFEKGENETMLRIANSMLEQGFSPEVIAKVTGLAIEQIYLLK